MRYPNVTFFYLRPHRTRTTKCKNYATLSGSLQKLHSWYTLQGKRNEIDTLDVCLFGFGRYGHFCGRYGVTCADMVVSDMVEG